MPIGLAQCQLGLQLLLLLPLLQLVRLAQSAGAGHRVSKRSVQTVYYPASSKQQYIMGLDPYEEKLLISLLGGGLAFIFALVIIVVCCRKYRIERGQKPGGGGGNRQWNPVMYTAAGRPAYYPTGYQPQTMMDPNVLDPARGASGAFGSDPSSYQQQQQGRHNLVDNTAYGSVPVEEMQQQQQQQPQQMQQQQGYNI